MLKSNDVLNQFVLSLLGLTLLGIGTSSAQLNEAGQNSCNFFSSDYLPSMSGTNFNDCSTANPNATPQNVNDPNRPWHRTNWTDWRPNNCFDQATGVRKISAHRYFNDATGAGGGVGLFLRQKEEPSGYYQNTSKDTKNDDFLNDSGVGNSYLASGLEWLDSRCGGGNSCHTFSFSQSYSGNIAGMAFNLMSARLHPGSGLLPVTAGISLDPGVAFGKSYGPRDLRRLPIQAYLPGWTGGQSCPSKQISVNGVTLTVPRNGGNLTRKNGFSAPLGTNDNGKNERCLIGGAVPWKEECVYAATSFGVYTPELCSFNTSAPAGAPNIVVAPKKMVQTPMLAWNSMNPFVSVPFARLVRVGSQWCNVPNLICLYRAGEQISRNGYQGVCAPGLTHNFYRHRTCDNSFAFDVYTDSVFTATTSSGFLRARYFQTQNRNAGTSDGGCLCTTFTPTIPVGAANCSDINFGGTPAGGGPYTENITDTGYIY
jgi:hypothetical protein